MSARAGDVIRETDATGRVRVIREVAEDACGNCVNHGLWRLTDAAGQVMGGGRYDMGQRTGEWHRWLHATDLAPEQSRELSGFESPFLSRATFVNGKLSGEWMISDARGRMSRSIAFVDGVRQGEFRTWAPTGQLVHVEPYFDGRLEGRSLVWSEVEHKLVHEATWVRGYRLIRSVARFDGRPETPKSEGDYLIGPTTPRGADDFWNGRPALANVGVECIPHGSWRGWFPNGQLAAEGRYAWGRPVGQFAWRYPNGQKAAAGAYDATGLPTDTWRWWTVDGLQAAVRSVPPGERMDAPPQVATLPSAVAVGAR